MTGIGKFQRAGLSMKEVEAARRLHGKNTFSKKKRAGFWRRFLANLGDPVIKVLLLALGLNLLLLFRSHDWFETVGIAVSVFLATFISTLSEHGSEAAFSRLCESCAAPLCRVRRGGRIMEIPSEEVVVGDVVLLAAGERIPADGVIFSGALSVDQSPLTGESRESEKRPSPTPAPFSPDSATALLAGCTVLSGEGEIVVTAVGDATLLGGISGELQDADRESPLKAKLSRLAAQISRIGYAAAALCVLTFLFYHLFIDAQFDRAELLRRITDLPYMAELLLHALTLGLTVVVVAVPEGLPLMISVVLSSNIKRMVRDQVLVRKPAGLEAAGSMNILFTDKTGTLTAGKLTLGKFHTVSGDFKSAAALRRQAPRLFEHICLAVHAVSGAERGEREGRPVATGGNSTGRALLTAFLTLPSPELTVRDRLPFDSNRKYAAATLKDGRCFWLGAPELLLPLIRASRDREDAVAAVPVTLRGEIRAAMARGERVLLLCEGAPPAGTQLPDALTLLAAVTFHDPLRSEAREAVRTLQGAGVQVVMMTGDGKETAARIATDCGILYGDRLCLEGRELAALPDEEVSALLPRLAVVARALPSDKSRLVRLSAAKGLVVGMTGDGINDAPALKSADVGFAMGSGTQVAKEAGDVVILDDNLSSVTRAVLYGRTIFKSIRKFITLQLVMNFCAVGISIIGPFIGFDSPVTVVQMLWINIVMDTLGGLAFAGEPPLPLYMQEPPKGRDEPILTKALARRIAYLAGFTVTLSVFFLKSHTVRGFYREMPEDICLLTAFFALFIFAGVLNCFNARTDRVRMLIGLSHNRSFLLIMPAVAAVQIAFIYLGGTVLRTVPLTPRELLVTLAMALTVIPVGWLHLLWRRLCGKKGLY